MSSTSSSGAPRSSDPCDCGPVVISSIVTTDPSCPNSRAQRRSEDAHTSRECQRTRTRVTGPRFGPAVRYASPRSTRAARTASRAALSRRRDIAGDSKSCADSFPKASRKKVRVWRHQSTASEHHRLICFCRLSGFGCRLHESVKKCLFGEKAVPGAHFRPRAWHTCSLRKKPSGTTLAESTTERPTQTRRYPLYLRFPKPNHALTRIMDSREEWRIRMKLWEPKAASHAARKAAPLQ